MASITARYYDDQGHPQEITAQIVPQVESTPQQNRELSDALLLCEAMREHIQRHPPGTRHHDKFARMFDKAERQFYELFNRYCPNGPFDLVFPNGTVVTHNPHSRHQDRFSAPKPT